MTTANQSGPLLIEWDDLFTAETDGYVRQLQAAGAAPLVRAVGDPGDAKVPWYRGHIVQTALAGVVGGLVAWALFEVTTGADIAENVTVSNIVSTVVIGFAIGLAISVWEGISARSFAKVLHSLKWAIPALAATTLVGGVIANAIYQPWIESLIMRLVSQAIMLGWSADEFSAAVVNAMHLPRGVAWGVVGLAAGTGVGLASRQLQRVINGALGGLLGGFIGGFVFDFFVSGATARAFGLVVTGLAVGLGIGLVEVARRQHWLEILTGGMAGKQFVLYTGRTSIGAGADNDVTLIKDPAIAAHHAVLIADDRGITASGTETTRPLLINGVPVPSQRLSDGDVLQFGSTLLRYRDKDEQPVAPGAIVG